VYQHLSRWSIGSHAYIDAPQPVLGASMCASLGANKAYFPAGGYNGMYYWKQGQPWTRMSRVSSSWCMLTSVSGNFRGFGERVQIQPMNGYWYLFGDSQQTGVSASAMCVNYGSSTLISGVFF
jgi:hypothetical protein